MFGKVNLYPIKVGKKCVSKKQAYNYSYFLQGLISRDTPTSPLCSKGCSEPCQVLCSVSLQLTLISVAPILTIFLSIFSDKVWVRLRFLPPPLPPPLHPTFSQLTDRFLWQGYGNSLGVHIKNWNSSSPKIYKYCWSALCLENRGSLHPKTFKMVKLKLHVNFLLPAMFSSP